MSINREQIIFMQHIAELIRKASDFGLLVTGGELYRTPEQQALHIKNGRSKTMNSQHLKRLAIDLNFFQESANGTLRLVSDGDNVQQLGTFWKSLDPANRWGGNWSSFKDNPHFERRENGKSTSSNEKISSTIQPSVVQPVSAVAPIPGSASSVPGLNLLVGTVGLRCQNFRYDVETIQRLLNLNAERIQLHGLLKCDGIIGQKTIDAINEFQKRILAQPNPNGTIRPKDATLAALCVALPKGFSSTLLSLIYLNSTDEAVQSFSPHIEECMKKYEINTPLRQAHFLSQIGHESGELRFREEIASGSAYENRHDLGNSQPGDGSLYKGRGLIQLTGRANYTKYSQTSGFNVDFVAEPGLIGTNDQFCVDVAGWYWMQRNLNTNADRDDLEGITRRINGGLNGLDERRRLLLRAKAIILVS